MLLLARDVFLHGPQLVLRWWFLGTGTTGNDDLNQFDSGIRLVSDEKSSTKVCKIGQSIELCDIYLQCFAVGRSPLLNLYLAINSDTEDSNIFFSFRNTNTTLYTAFVSTRQSYLGLLLLDSTIIFRLIHL